MRGLRKPIAGKVLDACGNPVQCRTIMGLHPQVFACSESEARSLLSPEAPRSVKPTRAI